MNPASASSIVGKLLGLLRRLPAVVGDHPVVVVPLVVLAVTAGASWFLLRRRIRARWWRDSRLITVLPPAKLTEAAAITGAHQFWRDLMGTTPPRSRRLLTGHPHITMEYWLNSAAAAVDTGIEFSVHLWIPGSLAPGRVENAVHAAWPGSLILRQGGSNEPGSALAKCATVTGGLVRPERAEHFPLHLPDSRDDTDPLRALESLAAAMKPGECAVVQVLARPGVGRRLRRYRASIRHLHTGRPAHSSILIGLLTGLVREALGILTAGPSTRHTTTPENRYRVTDPLRADELRAIRDKASDPQWEVALRYAAGTSATGPAARERVRGLADTTFAVFAVLAGRNALARHHLHHSGEVITGRRLRRGALLSVPELATIAHLPTRTPDLAGRRARAVPAPRQVTGRPLSQP